MAVKKISSSKENLTQEVVKEVNVEVKKEKTLKLVIDTATIKTPKDVEVKVCKSAIIFIKGEKRAALKGRTLEVSETATIKHANLLTFTKDEVMKRHLGSMNGLIRKINDNKELESILIQLFV